MTTTETDERTAYVSAELEWLLLLEEVAPEREPCPPDQLDEALETRCGCL